MDYFDVVDLSMIVSGCGYGLCGPEWRGHNIVIQHAKIYFPVAGSGWIVAAGRKTILKPGRLCFTPPGMEVSFGTPSMMRVHWLHYYPQSFQILHQLRALRQIVVFDGTVTKRWRSTCRSIPMSLEGSIGKLCHIHAMLLELTGILLAKLPEESAATRADYKRLLPVMKFLDANAECHPSLTHLAQIASLSPEHLHRLFRGVFHTTPHRYAHVRRMVLAQELLAEGLSSVSEVAERCGYEDAFYFSRVFRKHFGITPREARRGLPLVLMP